MKNHPMFLITDYLKSDGVENVDTVLLRNIIREYMYDLYTNVIYKDGYLICTEPINNCSKELTIIWVKKGMKLREVFEFKKLTDEMVKNKNYCRMVVIRTQVEDDVKTRLKYCNIDRISWNDIIFKGWVNSWRGKEVKK